MNNYIDLSGGEDEYDGYKEFIMQHADFMRQAYNVPLNLLLLVVQRRLDAEKDFYFGTDDDSKIAYDFFNNLIAQICCRYIDEVSYPQDKNYGLD